MFAHRGPRLWLVSLAAGFALLVIPAAARAVAPVCEAEADHELAAGLTVETPKPACTDTEDAADDLSIAITAAPTTGTLDPAGTIPITTVRTYTAAEDAAGTTDTYTYRAVDSNGDMSNEVVVSVAIQGANAPVCDDPAALTVQAGGSIAIPDPECADDDGDGFELFFDDPVNGVLDFGTGIYTAPASFSGEDTIAFVAIDDWGFESDEGTITIDVTAKPPVVKPPVKPKPPVKAQPSAPPDLTAPSLALLAPPLMKPRAATRRGIPFTATTSEAGRLVIQLFVGRNTARRYRLAKNPTGRVLVGSLTRDIAAGETAVKVKLSSKARKRLKKAANVQLKMVARISDAAGNVRTKRMRITLGQS